jgi:hypothetical protein
MESSTAFSYHRMAQNFRNEVGQNFRNSQRMFMRQFSICTLNQIIVSLRQGSGILTTGF